MALAMYQAAAFPLPADPENVLANCALFEPGRVKNVLLFSPFHSMIESSDSLIYLARAELLFLVLFLLVVHDQMSRSGTALRRFETSP